MDSLTGQLSKLQEQVQALSLLPSIVTQQASSISLLQSKNDAQEASISHLYAENDSLRSLLHFHETEAHPRGRFVYDPVGLIVGGVKKGCWRWHSPSYSLSEVARGGVNDDVRFATMEDLPVEIMDEITSLLTLSERAKLCRVSFRVLELTSRSVYGEIVLTSLASAARLVNARTFIGGQRSRLKSLLRPSRLVLRASNPNGVTHRHPIDRHRWLCTTELQIYSDLDFEQDLWYWSNVLSRLDPVHLHLVSKSSLPLTMTHLPLTITHSQAAEENSLFDLVFRKWRRLEDITMTGAGSVFLISSSAFESPRFAFGYLARKEDARRHRTSSALSRVPVKPWKVTVQKTQRFGEIDFYCVDFVEVQREETLFAAIEAMKSLPSNFESILIKVEIVR